MIDNMQVDTVDVQAVTPGKGTSGADKPTYATTITGMPCLVLDASVSWAAMYAQRKLNLTHQVFTNQKPVVKVGYQLLWEGKVLRVVGVMDKGGKGQVMQIDVQELS